MSYYKIIITDKNTNTVETYYGDDIDYNLYDIEKYVNITREKGYIDDIVEIKNLKYNMEVLVDLDHKPNSKYKECSVQIINTYIVPPQVVAVLPTETVTIVEMVPENKIETVVIVAAVPENKIETVTVVATVPENKIETVVVAAVPEKEVLVCIILEQVSRYYVFNTNDTKYKDIYKPFLVHLKEKEQKEQYFELSVILQEHMDEMWPLNEVTEANNPKLYSSMSNINILSQLYDSICYFKLPSGYQFKFKDAIRYYLSPEELYNIVDITGMHINWMNEWAVKFNMRFPGTNLSIIMSEDSIFLQPFFSSWLSFLVIEIFLQPTYDVNVHTMCIQERILYIFLHLMTTIEYSIMEDVIEELFDTIKIKIKYFAEKRGFLLEWKATYDVLFEKWENAIVSKNTYINKTNDKYFIRVPVSKQF
jgi:hypothetical protein